MNRPILHRYAAGTVLLLQLSVAGALGTAGCEGSAETCRDCGLGGETAATAGTSATGGGAVASAGATTLNATGTALPSVPSGGAQPSGRSAAYVNAGAGGTYGSDAKGNDTTRAGASSSSSCSGLPQLERLTPTQLHDVLKVSDPLLIDVHTPYEGKLPQTDASIPYTDVDAIEAFAQYDHCADIILTCLGGGMSVSAGNALLRRGYVHIRDLLGGMNAWKASGYPLE